VEHGPRYNSSFLSVNPTPSFELTEIRPEKKFLEGLQNENGPSRKEGPFLHLIEGDF